MLIRKLCNAKTKLLTRAPQYLEGLYGFSECNHFYVCSHLDNHMKLTNFYKNKSQIQ